MKKQLKALKSLANAFQDRRINEMPATHVDRSERRSKVKGKASWKRLMVAVGLGVALMGMNVYPAVSEVTAAGGMAQSELSSGPSNVTMREPNTVDSCDARIHASAEFFKPGTSDVNASWTSTGELNIGRYDHTATLLPDGKVLVAGGKGSDTCFKPTSSAELYDPVSGTWSPTGSLNTARADHTATLLQSGLVLVAGGYAADVDLNSAELYDPATGTWRPTASFKNIRNSDSSDAPLLQNGKVLVVGGGDAKLEAELYDPETEIWSSTSPPTAYLLNMALLPDGKVFGLGSDWDYGAVAELYDPVTQHWSSAGYFEFDPVTTTPLPNGKVLVMGISFGPQRDAVAAMYDTSTDMWSTAPTRTFGAPESGGWKAMLQADGQVLVSGINGAALFDAMTETWSLTSRPTVPRHQHTATLLPNGATLIAGGIDNGLVSPPWIANVWILKGGRSVSTIVAGTKAKKLSLGVYGVDFDSRAGLLVNGEALELVSASGTTLVGRFTNPMVSTPGELSIQVRNSSGKISNTVTVLVVARQSP